MSPAPLPAPAGLELLLTPENLLRAGHDELPVYSQPEDLSQFTDEPRPVRELRQRQAYHWY
ncbi:MAG: hypothetical protein VKO64_03355 [Candidatus Sericytochromatia bacterium]|nr:hypothetical protein [Candidatus Sericytochromatia bacterium]